MALTGSPVVNQLTHTIIGRAIEVHRTLGPGLLESVYDRCLMFELASLNLEVERRRPLPLVYKGMLIEDAYFPDLVVNDSVIVELKCVEQVTPLHEAQLLTYLKLTGCEVGLILNFNSVVLKDGIVRKMNSSGT